MKLVVHADDFGLTELVNAGIVRAHLQGVLTSTSLIANGRAFAHAVQLSKQVPTLDIGLHLTLVEERPLLSPLLVPTLVGADGRFHRHATVFTREYLRGRISVEEVRAELDAQLERVRGEGIPVSHIDSHQHVHMLPGVFRIAASMARRHGIRFVRSPGERPRAYMLGGVQALSRLAQQSVLRSLSALGRRHGVRSTDTFAGFFHGGHLVSRALRQVIESLPLDGSCELMCHPGVDDPDTPYSHWGYEWAGELEALLDPHLPTLLRDRGIELQSYRELALQELAAETARSGA